MGCINDVFDTDLLVRRAVRWDALDIHIRLLSMVLFLFFFFFGGIKLKSTSRCRAIHLQANKGHITGAHGLFLWCGCFRRTVLRWLIPKYHLALIDFALSFVLADSSCIPASPPPPPQPRIACIPVPQLLASQSPNCSDWFLLFLLHSLITSQPLALVDYQSASCICWLPISLLHKLSTNQPLALVDYQSTSCISWLPINLLH